MATTYSNNTKHTDIELGVSRGQIDYINTQNYGGGVYLQSDRNPEDVPASNITGIQFPPRNIQPRGRVAGGNSLTEFNSSLTDGLSPGLTIGNNPLQNVFSTKEFEGQNDNAGQTVFTAFPEFDPYIRTHRIPYASKIIPIFAQGTETNAPYTGNFSYSLLKLLDITLPYVKANILWGEITNIVPSSVAGSTASSLLSNYFGRDQYIQYPLYNAIEVIFNAKSVLGAGSGTFHPSGGAWFKKTFLISWALKSFTEKPFRTVSDSFTIQRKYWYPTGLLPQANEFFPNYALERYGVYTHDDTVPPSDINGNEYGNVLSNWVLNWGGDAPPSYFTDNESPLNITLDDEVKTANIKISVPVRRQGQVDHTKFMIKGIAKLI